MYIDVYMQTEILFLIAYCYHRHGFFPIYERYTRETLPAGFSPYPVVTHASTVVPTEYRLGEGYPSSSKLSKELDKVFPQAAHVTLEAGDMLINPPFSWHAIKVDQMSISLSLRGDKQDVRQRMRWCS